MNAVWFTGRRKISPIPESPHKKQYRKGWAICDEKADGAALP